MLLICSLEIAFINENVKVFPPSRFYSHGMGEVLILTTRCESRHSSVCHFKIQRVGGAVNLTSQNICAL